MTAASPSIEIVTYRDDLQPAFAALNIEWIERYFTLEDTDRLYLNDPARTIIEPGGAVLFLLENGVPVGTCALIKEDEHTFELAKMAVTPAAQGRGYGRRLMEAALAEARHRGATHIVLLSDSTLQPAIRLYERFGFRHVPRADDLPYARGDVQMELRLNETASPD